MASRSNQYIFGEFSPDEFNQFFVTPRCYVELPPFNDKVSCISHNSGGYCPPAVPYITESVRRQVCGEDYQHIEFGVDEVMSSEPVSMKDPLYKVSSTLNPQAPEFILGCQSAQKTLPAATPIADIPDGTDFSSVDCADSEASVLDSHQASSDLDGVSSSLGQRERKKKKKRPPGYYNYLEGSSNSSGGAVDGVAASGLVNGHALSAPALASEDMVGEVLSGANLAPATPLTSAPSTARAAPPSNQRTCISPDQSSLDLTSGAASLSDGHAAASSSSSSSSSQSSGLAEGARTAAQHMDPLALESPELQGRGGKSPCPNSPSPPPAAVATTAPATTDEDQPEGSGQANGLPEAAPADETVDRFQDSSETRSALASPPSDSEAQPVTEQASLPAPAAVSVANPPKSWASLFHNSKPLPGGPQAYVEVKNISTVVAVSPATVELPEKLCEVREGPVPVSEDPMAPKLAELIENVKLIHKPVSLQPRGLVNKGNWCYINATLQALIACPPMYHLMKSIPIFSEMQRPCTSTPMMDNFVRLVNEFSNMPVPSKAKQQAAGEKIIKDIRPGVPFEPTYIYRLLTLIKSSLSEKGRQEDAEEYLGFTLNGLHEEMLALKKLISPQEEKVSTPNGPGSHPGAEEDPAEREGEEGSEDEWEQVGPRNKTSITRQADFIRTPITDIFGGHIRSVVYQQSSKESATLQPFFTLQLDIQSEKIRTVQEALETMVARESVQGYTTKTKQEIEISRRVTLEELPPVLVLHLKRFVFEKTGGCQKLIKNIDYPVDLEISKDLLSPGVRSKTLKGQRTYRLFAVVYHHGNSATGGHYTTDVFHIGLNGWLRIDDQAVKVINQYHVVKQTAERTAYLLYYRRVDLL
ncbi:ubiquitin carboxyl-terminal hydrolase 10 isoform X2 [Pygocentrus nattereri]|uniref:ubiquitin carboxyl-terminal hydrolase 10 isoform X2 n=1 Tax=Pygocentrus nattereri TaxID=42514 RepID=UPI0008143183|nr:ubiquitin carboxyl-terminal hydrolase 10 isoform X2 [Pygocentrus nattereri]